MGKKLKSGQLITGRKKLAEELNFSERQIRTAMEKLRSTGEVTYETTNKYTIVTVVNWEDYQSNEEIPTKSATNERPTKDQQATNERPHRKNVKNNKNVKKYNTRTREESYPSGYSGVKNLGDD
jgi:biotin operon repressor